MNPVAPAPETCLVCGGHSLTRLRACRNESPAGKALFRGGSIFACGECGVAQLWPRPSEKALEEYYATEYRRGGRYGSDAADISRFPRDNLFFFNRGESVAELLEPYLRASSERPRILDVGAGYGHILYALGSRFPLAERLAHELSKPCIAHLRSIGVHVLAEDLPSALAASDTGFDAIILSHVLEHVRDPVGTLSMLTRHLAPTGVLYVEVPHASPAMLARHPDSPWAPRHDEPHLTFFGADALRATLLRSGAAPAFIETAGPMFRDVSALRYALPPLRPLIRRSIPQVVMRVARRVAPARTTLRDREPDFFSYGGYRIWLRSISHAQVGT